MSAGAAPEAVIVIGAGRQGRNAVTVCRALGTEPLGFLDDTLAPGTLVDGVEVLGPFSDIAHHAREGTASFAVAVGASAPRRSVAESFDRSRLATLVHPTTVVVGGAHVGPGSYVAPFGLIRSGARLGDGVLLESHTSVGVDCSIGDYVTTGSGVRITAGVSVGSETLLGAGAVITNEARVGTRAVVAAGAAVVRDVPDGAFVAGVPAAVRERAPSEGQEPRPAGGYRAPST